MPTDRPLWTPDPAAAARTHLEAFRSLAERESGEALPDFGALHAWSVRDRERFWSLVWRHCEILGAPGDVVLDGGDRMPGARWFPGARLNFAENLLWRNDAAPALIFRGEHGVRREISFAELRARVGRLAHAMRAAGLEPGDRVAGFVPNLPETVVAALAAASIGALWSSCSPDFGDGGVIDRFGQIEPRWLFCADGYRYNGRDVDSLARIEGLLESLPSIERTVVIPYLDDPPEERIRALRGGVRLAEVEREGEGRGQPVFDALPFDHPLYVMFSSGTTGKPKCIVHGVGGSLLQHAKEQRLHVDLHADERLFYFTTCGWMMWNWLVSGLAAGATLVLYDGSPFHPGPETLFDLAEQERIDVFGVSAKFIDAVAKAGLAPATTHDLGHVRALLSTGSPLAPESFDYVYESVAPHTQLASISGGTDILSCFVLGNPTAPVWRGEIQAPGLGMDVAVFDAEGQRCLRTPGELVCTQAFPSMPIGFWNDADGSRYRAAYFERFAGVWHHGDWMQTTEHGGFVIQGRSDAVLNPGGVRIGTAEIYRQVERLDEVVESIAIGQEWDGDVRVVLFVVLREGAALDDDLRARICDAIRQGASPRHVPARVLQVPDIPRTRSGKITELAVRDVVHGRSVANVEALANPEALAHFEGCEELRS